jgi:hypothetical protein
MKHKRRLMSIAMVSIMLVSLCAVVSTTSVSAATSSSAKASVSAATSSVKTQSAVVGAPAGIVGAPAVTTRDYNSIDLFVRGGDNALWWRTLANGKWSAWKSLGGYLTSSPFATSIRNNDIWVAVRGGDGACYSIYTGDGGATWAWKYEGGQLLAGTSPAIYNDLAEYGGLRGILVTGTNHVLYYKAVSSYMEWTDWTPVGGYLTSSPGVLTYNYNVAAAGRGGTNGALYVTYSTDWGETYSAWTYKGGSILAGTGPAVWGPEEFYVIGTNNQLYWYSSGSWKSLGGYLTSSPSVTASNGFPSIDVFAIGGDGNIWSRNTTNGGSSWNPWYKLPA